LFLKGNSTAEEIAEEIKLKKVNISASGVKRIIHEIHVTNFPNKPKKELINNTLISSVDDLFPTMR
jgi:hypothetical protein